jgi:hypothetical protein
MLVAPRRLVGGNQDQLRSLSDSTNRMFGRF